MADNPLLEDFTLPPFSRIRPEHVVSAIDTLLQQNRDEIAALQLLFQRPYRQRALTLAEPHGYLRTLLDLGAPMDQLLRQYERRYSYPDRRSYRDRRHRRTPNLWT